MFTAIWYPAVKKERKWEERIKRDRHSEQIPGESEKIFTVWKCRQQNRVHKRRSEISRLKSRGVKLHDPASLM